MPKKNSGHHQRYYSAANRSLEGEEVKNGPKGFSKEDPNIDLIKKKAYLFTKRYEDRTVVSPGFLAQLDADFAAIRPFDYI